MAAGEARGRVTNGLLPFAIRGTNDVNSRKRLLQIAQERNELFVNQFATSL